MNFHVISCMEKALGQSLLHGVVERAYKKKRFSVNFLNPRDFTSDVHQTIDDRPFGGGDGMLMMAEPMAQGLERVLSKASGPVLMLSPQGKRWSDSWARQLSQEADVTLICARYGGVDQRFLNAYPVQEVSIGDYVLSGGELAAAVLMDSVIRLLPGVLGHDQSAHQDSFAHRGLLEAPHFTRPRLWRDMEVPPVFLQGHHKKINGYKEKLSWLVTLQKRPDLLAEVEIPHRELQGFLQTLEKSETQALGLDRETLQSTLGKIAQEAD